MRVVFMGTPEFAVPTLERVRMGHDVVLALTRPDAVRSRGGKVAPSPVRVAAEAMGVPVVSASRITTDVEAAIAAAHPDVVVVAAFGAILPDELLDVPAFGTLNVHASLLPRWRGAAPIQRAVLAGDDVVGVSIMRIVHDLDAGPFCRQVAVPVAEKGAVELTDELAALGATEMVAALDDIAAGTVIWSEQDASKATYAPRLTKAEMLLTPSDSALANARRVAASTNAAPARFALAGRGMRATVARTVSGRVVAAGEVLRMGKHVYLGCADNTALELVRVKPDGKREMDAGAWALGLRGDSISWSEV